MIVAEKVQKAVREENLHLALERVAAPAGLPRRVRNVDDDVAEKLSAPRRGAGFGCFEGREREDIGRTVEAAEAAVQRAHACVAAEKDREGGALRACFEKEAAGPGARSRHRRRIPRGHENLDGRGALRRADARVAPLTLQRNSP